ncbi:MAG: hypothetical protein IM568_07485 [Flavobacterium sp.]|nr:hypothetical protein [Flavobacterium sp.]
MNIPQKELSEQAGLTLRTIQQIDNNEAMPSLYSFWKSILSIVLVIYLFTSYLKLNQE